MYFGLAFIYIFRRNTYSSVILLTLFDLVTSIAAQEG